MKKLLGGLYLTLILLFLYLPIGTLMVLSFNEGKSMNAWQGFSTKWYAEMFRNQEIMEALGNTLTIALWASVAATVVGVLACVGLQAMSEKNRSFFMAAEQYSASECGYCDWDLDHDEFFAVRHQLELRNGAVCAHYLLHPVCDPVGDAEIQATGKSRL